MHFVSDVVHLLSMEHDFILGKRDRKCGKGDKSGELLMSYGSNCTIFSECSNDDFKNYTGEILDDFTDMI